MASTIIVKQIDATQNVIASFIVRPPFCRA